MSDTPLVDQNIVEFAKRSIHVEPATDLEIQGFLESLDAEGKEVYTQHPDYWPQRLIARLVSTHNRAKLPTAADLDAVADEQHIRESTSTPLVDWKNDESVVRAAFAGSFVFPTNSGRVILMDRLPQTILGENWEEARQHPRVVAFEASNRPAQLPALPEETGFEGENCAYVTGAHVGITADHMRRFLGCLKTMGVELALSRRAQPQDASEDSARLDWLQEHEAHLHTHRERLGDGYGIWWNVVKRQKSISGHPLGSPRAAIDAAIERTTERIVAQRKAGA